MEKKRFQWFSGSQLKLLAIITMLIDHTAAFLLKEHPRITATLFAIGTTKISIYYLMRLIGRMAFPLFCFLLTEGFVYTKSRKAYGRNLLIFALLSELPWNFVHSGGWTYEKQNVFFTLFLGFCALCVLERFKDRFWTCTLSTLCIFAVSVFLRADYGFTGVATILAMYLLRRQIAVCAIVCSCMLPAFWRAGLAFVPICFYNGQRGFLRGKVGKYLFYAFYPVHLLLIACLRFLF